MTQRTYGRLSVETSRENKVLFPHDGFTKSDLIDYYDRIADTMMPHIKDRPITLQRFPDGIGEEGFYQKNVSDYFPDWIDKIEIKIKDGTNTQLLCNKKAGLVYLADQASITFHQWLSRKGNLNEPDLMVFDLDPSGNDFADVRKSARLLCDVLDELGLKPFAQLTGSKGIHLIVPLRAPTDFDSVRDFARTVADILTERHESLMTTEQRKDKRQGRVFIDTLRNAYGQTMVAPYSVRPRQGAPVATPIGLDELSDSKLSPDKYTIRTIFKRLASRNDPWKNMLRLARSLDKAKRTLEDLNK